VHIQFTPAQIFPDLRERNICFNVSSTLNTKDSERGEAAARHLHVDSSFAYTL
jgi:hypothetical protein